MTDARATCGHERSRWYSEQLQDYYGDRVLAEHQCICKSLGRCSASAAPSTFAAAQLSFVGDRYAMQRDGRPWRVVVVSMQTGVPESPITMSRRHEQFASRVVQDFKHRNAHIRGVTTATRVLWGREPGSDRANELIETSSGEVHLLDALAQVNASLCARVIKAGSVVGSPTRTMYDNCATHLRAAFERLEPTIVHSQARSASGAHSTTHHSVLAATDQIDWDDSGETVGVARLGDRRFVVVSLAHPSSGPPTAWSWPKHAYCVNVAVPALTRARNLALSLRDESPA